jgi:predicted nucleic acid-binding protein
MAEREVFVDTSGLHAIVDKRDAHHDAAREAVVALARRGSKLVVTDYIVDETVTLARARGNDRVALRVLDLIERSVGIRVEWIDAARFDATKAYVRKHLDHAYSFTDCSSFVVMRELRIRKALTTDGHFTEAGFERLLPDLRS